MSDRTSTLTAVLVDAVSGPARGIRAEITGIGESVGRTTALLQGIGQGIGQSVFFALRDAIGSVTRAIPDLLDQGHAYLDLLHQLQLESGMTAEQTSALVGTMRMMGVPTEDLATLFARLGVNLADNEGKFRALGIATRDATGAQLSAAQIIENTRRAVAEHGASLQTTAALQDLFGRSGFKLIEYFQASDEEIRRATDSVQRWGGIVSQAAIAGADAFGDTLESLRTGVTLIGTSIAAAVDPYLRAFVDSFSRFVQSHLNEIVQFAVAVTSTITGFVSGLFGITDTLSVSLGAAGAAVNDSSAGVKDWAKNTADAAGGADAFTKSIEAQIDAIDAHAHALQVAEDRRHALQQRARLQDSLAAAQAQLADLRGNAPFTEGLSSAEAVLARQKHAQDIIDAERNVADQRQAIGDFELDQRDRAERELAARQKQRLQEQLADHKTAAAAILKEGLRAESGITDAFTGTLANIGVKTEEFGKTAADAFKAGVDAAQTFLALLVGSERQLPNGTTVRTGGIVGSLGDVGRVFQDLGGFAREVFGLLGPVVDLFGDLEDALNGIKDALDHLGDAIHDFLVRLHAELGIPDLPIPDPRNIDVPDIAKNIAQGILNLFPGHATGGYVPPTPGGQLVRVGEGGEGEYIVPASRFGGQPIVLEYHQHSVWPPTAQHGREVREWIDEQLAIVADNVPVGLVGFRARG